MQSLHFKLGSFPVTISPTVLLLFGFILFTNAESGVSTAAGIAGTVTLALLVAVLTHELGHAFLAKKTGATPEIRLHGMGGVTMWRPSRPVSAGERFWISAGGSATQLVVAFGVFAAGKAGLLGRLLEDTFSGSPFSFPSYAFGIGGYGVLFIAMVVYLGMVWSLFNYLPIPGLDGYHMLAAVLDGKMDPEAAKRLLRTVGVVVAGGGAIYAYTHGYTFLAYYLGFRVVESFQRG